MLFFLPPFILLSLSLILVPQLLVPCYLASCTQSVNLFSFTRVKSNDPALEGSWTEPEMQQVLGGVLGVGGGGASGCSGRRRQKDRPPARHRRPPARHRHHRHRRRCLRTGSLIARDMSRRVHSRLAAGTGSTVHSVVRAFECVCVRACGRVCASRLAFECVCVRASMGVGRGYVQADLHTSACICVRLHVCPLVKMFGGLLLSIFFYWLV